MPVDIIVTLDGATAYMIEDTVPTGWTITSAPGGTILGSGSKVSYSALSGAVDTTFTYQVAIPSGTTPGQYCFTCEFGIGTSPLGPLDCGDMCVDVGEAPVGETPEDPQDTSQDGAASGGEISIPGPLPTVTPTGTVPVPEKSETLAPSVTPTESMTPAATSTKKLATKPDVEGIVPGFGALFAVAGLLAVAYMFRRR